MARELRFFCDVTCAKKKVYATYTKKKFPSKRKHDSREKKYATYAKKKISELRLFSQVSYAFLVLQGTSGEWVSVVAVSLQA